MNSLRWSGHSDPLQGFGRSANNVFSTPSLLRGICEGEHLPEAVHGRKANAAKEAPVLGQMVVCQSKHSAGRRVLEPDRRKTSRDSPIGTTVPTRMIVPLPRRDSVPLADAEFDKLLLHLSETPVLALVDRLKEPVAMHDPHGQDNFTAQFACG